MRPKMPPLVGIFLTVLIDLLSFGLVIPDIQLRGHALTAPFGYDARTTGIAVGVLIATYSFVQFLAAPFLGRLSDSRGRRNILLVTSAMAFVAMIVYANSDQLWIMFVARALGGLSAANLGVAYAYVADVTTPENRAKSMGLIGAAFGLGFILGPAVGGFLASLDHVHHLNTLGIAVTDESLRSIQAFQGKPQILGYTAAAMSLINFIYIYFFVAESLKPSDRGSEGRRGATLQNLKLALSTPGLGILIILFFVANFAFANLESTYFRLVDERFKLTQMQGTYVLAVVGVATAFTQGFLIRILQPKFGEVKLLRISYALQAPLLALVPFFYPWAPQLLGAAGLGVSSGLAQPCLSSLISQNTPRDMQGGVFGVTQSLGSMARIIGPIFGNFLFGYGAAIPYLVAGVLMLGPVAMAWLIRARTGGDQVADASSGPIH